MKRVSIIGSGGAGKSTLARRMGEILELPVIHLDSRFWRPGWTETPTEEWRQIVEDLVKPDRWIIDGNFGGTMEIRLEASDTVIYLDYPPFVCLRRAIKRWITHWNKTRPDMGEGCPEKMDSEFLRWVWMFPTETKPNIEKRLLNLNQKTRLVRLTSPRATGKFLNSLRSAKN